MYYTENLQKLVKGSRDDLGLSAVNGIKALSMIFIVCGHSLFFIVGGPVLNTDFYAAVRYIICVMRDICLFRTYILILYIHSRSHCHGHMDINSNGYIYVYI